MLISELARQTGLTPDTIRFYEKKGLLDGRHMTRMENNYKEYSLAAVERLRLVSHSKCAGFTLTEIVQLFRDWETLSEERRQEIFLEKMQQINRRMEEMEKMKVYLHSTMPACIVERSCCG